MRNNNKIRNDMTDFFFLKNCSRLSIMSKNRVKTMSRRVQQINK